MVDSVRFGRVENWRSVCSLGLEWGSVAAVIATALWIDLLPVYALAVVLIGALQHRLAALGHEAAHGVLFTHRFWNDFIADLGCFFPLLATVENYRRWHLAHHACPNDPERDPDILNLGHWIMRERFPMSRGRMIWLVLWRWVSAPVSLGLYLFEYMKLNTFGGGKGVRPPSKRRGWYPAWAAILARVAFYAVVVAGLLQIEGRTALVLLALWMIPLTTTFPYFLMLRDTFQHTNADAGRYTNTRVFRVHPLVRWAVFPYGQDMHLPHHASPSVPHYRLEALHDHLCASQEAYGTAAVECRGVLWNRTGEPTISDVLTHKGA